MVSQISLIRNLLHCNTMRQRVCLLALGLLCVASGHALQPTGELRACHRSDPEINACLLEQAGIVVKRFKDGAPEYGLPPIDPLNVEFMSVEGDLDAIKIKMIMKNISLHGHSESIFTKVKFDPTSLSGEVSYTIPNMLMTCDYFATGRLFVIPLESSAHFNGNFSGVDMKLTFRLKTVKRKGVEYLSVDKLQYTMRVEKAKIRLTSINPDFQPQASVIEDFFNSNDRLVLDTVNPLAVQHGVEFYKHILESYIRRLPVNDVLPN